MKKLILLSVLFVGIYSCSHEPFETKTKTIDGYTFEYVTDDPTGTRIYTLDNGLKVYLSRYENAPRIHVFTAVKAGGKNDPANNTGLAHYLEHMMFKGNRYFGSIDYEKEKILLDSIEQAFNAYGKLTDKKERKKLYEEIDALSNEAAKLAIPNEYDKMISVMGGKGLNAYTTHDRTVYTVDIPSNEIERFLEVEGLRFKQIVNRLFHTELEAVYEEKNRSLDNDGWKVFETLYKNIFEEHPYGSQTVIGTIDHLKNPSITEIVNYFNSYYRPNNVAICMSGELDYTKTIQLIEKNFGDWKANENLPTWERVQEKPIQSPKVAEVFGPQQERLSIGFRFDGTKNDTHAKVKLIDMLLNNSKAGLIDLNLVQKQTVLSAGSYVNELNDYNIHTFYGTAKQGQTLEDVKDLILEQIEAVKSGSFDDWLVEAVVNDLKKSVMQQDESSYANYYRANSMVMAFTTDTKWEQEVKHLDRLSNITKEELVAFANEHYKDNYVVVYKRNGEDTSTQKVEKPSITKVPLNREIKSEFHTALSDKKVDKLQPKFLDFEKDLTHYSIGNLKVISKENSANDLFELTYLFDFGNNADPAIGLAGNFMNYVGIEGLKPDELQQELYKLGCEYRVRTREKETRITLSGLSENMEKALVLFEKVLNQPQADEEALTKLVDRIQKSRVDAKKNKRTILQTGLYSYSVYGADNPFTNVLSEEELKKIKVEELTTIISGLKTYPHRIIYYGNKNKEELTQLISTYHETPDQFTAVPNLKTFEELDHKERNVFWAHYDMVQTEIVLLAKGEPLDISKSAAIQLFNEYFGGGMNSIVFQEIREAQGLAYSVYSAYFQANQTKKSDYVFSYVGIQSDKQKEALSSMFGLINKLPESENAFDIAKKAILNKIESERITKSAVINRYLSAEKKGITDDIRASVYNEVKNMDFEDLNAFHSKYIKDKPHDILVIGNKDNLDFQNLSQYGTVKELDLETIFGY